MSGKLFAVAQETKLHCDIRPSFATAFRNWRLKSNISLKTIAADLGVSIATVNSWGLGNRFPTGRHFEMLADYTGMPPCRLFCIMADKCVPAECLKLHCDIRASFATAFRNWRLKSNISLKTIAADLGVSIATVNSWELGNRFPTGRHFELLADYTGMPPCRLFCTMADKCVPAECLLALPKRKQPDAGAPRRPLHSK
jgi:transcriptional regulator with XRE-family HTH domain